MLPCPRKSTLGPGTQLADQRKSTQTHGQHLTEFSTIFLLVYMNRIMPERPVLMACARRDRAVSLCRDDNRHSMLTSAASSSSSSLSMGPKCCRLGGGAGADGCCRLACDSRRSASASSCVATTSITSSQLCSCSVSSCPHSMASRHLLIVQSSRSLAAPLFPTG